MTPYLFIHAFSGHYRVVSISLRNSERGDGAATAQWVVKLNRSLIYKLKNPVYEQVFPPKQKKDPARPFAGFLTGGDMITLWGQRCGGPEEIP